MPHESFSDLHKQRCLLWLFTLIFNHPPALLAITGATCQPDVIPRMTTAPRYGDDMIDGRIIPHVTTLLVPMERSPLVCLLLAHIANAPIPLNEGI